MSWLNFNDSLTNLRGQLSNLASGVLSESLVSETGEDGKKEERLQELEKLIVTQENEIRELRKLNDELQEKAGKNTQAVPQKFNDDSASKEWTWEPAEADRSPPDEEIIRNLKKQITELETEKRDLIVSLEQLDLDCQQTTEKVITLKDALQVEHNNLQEKYHVLVQDHKKLWRSKEDDEKTIAKMQQRINELDVEIKSQATKNKEEPALKLHENDRIKKLEDLLTRCNEEKEILSQDLQHAKKRHLEYESKIEAYQARKIADQEQYDNLSKILQGYEDQVKLYKEKCIKLESEMNMSKVHTNATHNNDDSYYVMILSDTFQKFMDYSLPAELTNHTNSFTATVESTMKHLLELKYKTDTLEKQVESLLNEKNIILKEKNEEIERLLDNSELLSQEIIDKNEALKHYEEERRELIKNNDILISELDDYRNKSSLHTISESNEDSLILLENQLESSNKRIEELEEELARRKEDYSTVKNHYEMLYKDHNTTSLQYKNLLEDYEKIKESYSQCYTENESLSDTVDKIQTDYENSEHKYSEINIGMETLKEETENLQAQIDTLVKKNKKLEHDNLKYQGENEISQSEIEDLKQTLSVELQTREDLENEIRTLKEKLQNIKMSETTLKLQYDRDLQALVDSTSKLEEITKAYGEIQETLEKVNFERAELSIQCKLLEEELTKKDHQMDQQVTHLKTLLTNTKHEDEKQLIETQELLEKIKFEYEELKINYNTLEEKYRTIDESLKVKEEEIISKDEIIVNIQNELEDLKEENGKFRTLNIKDHNEMVEFIRQKSELEEKLFRYEALLTSIKNETEKKSTDAQQALDKINSEHSELNIKYEILTEKYKDVEKELENKEKDVNLKQETILKIQNEITELRNQNEKFASSNVKDYEEIIKNKHELEEKLITYEKIIDNIKAENEKKITEILEANKQAETNYIEKAKTLEVALSELTQNNNNLIASLTAKHEESHQYYLEIQRLNQILATEVERNKNMAAEMNSIATKSAESFQIQDLNAKITTLNEEIERLSEHNLFLKSKCDVLGQTLLEEQQNAKRMIEDRANATSEKEISLSKELQRLRQHLLEIEEQHTQEIMVADKKITEMQAKMVVLEQREKEATSLHTSVNIRTNQHVETLQNQLQLVTNQRDELRKKISDAEDTITKQSAGLANLEFVLRQFQEDKEKGIQLETERIRRQIAVERNVQEDLRKEVTYLKNQLDESKQGLLAAARLNDQMEMSKHQILVLKEENDKLRENLRKNEEQQNASGNQEAKVDKMLIKNLVVGFITSNNISLNKDQHQILKIISTVLDFNQHDNERINLNKSNQASWLSSILHPNVLSQNQAMSQESLSQAFVKFLENESKPRQLPKLLDPDIPMEDVGNTPQPLLLNEVVLPTFADFGQNRNSSSILKDVLKDNN